MKLTYPNLNENGSDSLEPHEMPPAQHECTVCRRIFSTKNHLRRHEASHASESRVNCEFCGREYSRTDALRRHYQNCAEIGSRKPTPIQPGRRRKACDHCAKNRIVCDGGSPCASCETQGSRCSYRRLQSNTGSLSGLNSSITRVSTRSQTASSIRGDTDLPTTRLSVPFLLNYSATSNRHPGEVNNVLTALATADSGGEPDPGIPSLLLEAERADLFSEESWKLFFGSYEDQRHFKTSFVPISLEDVTEREQAASRVLEILNQPSTKYFHDIDHTQASAFFTKENIHDFVLAYFDGTVRPRSRIILKSTFNLPSTSTPLLLSILLMGAICAGSKDDKSNAAKYADLAEYIVFEDPTFQRLVYQKRESRCDPLAKNDVQFLQAAILMILIQISSPNAESRRRVRIHRYPTLVSVARAAGLTQIKNIWHDPNTQIDQELFRANELRIRIMASVAMIDTHFIIFFNTLPVLSPFELGFDLPAEEAGIDFTDSSAWEEWVVKERKQQRPPPLNQFIQDLMSDNWSGADDPRFQNLNIFALFIIISKLHPIIFNLRSSLINTESQIIQVERALSRWLILWESLKPRLTKGEIFRAGFMTHAPDLLVFARLLLRTPLSETDDIAKDSMADIHELLKGPSS